MESTFIRYSIFFSILLSFFHVDADPEFCSRGFKMASRFYQCWEQATFENKYPPLYEPHQYLDNKFVEDYATHMCSVVKPQALKCLKDGIRECTNLGKLMEMADQSGGACLRNKLNPFFKTHVIDQLVAIEGDSPCFQLADNTYECYRAAGQKVMQMGSQSDDIVTFHRVADKFFNAYWECMVNIYKSNEKMCPHWQIPMLLTLQKTAMPSLFGLKLRPEQVQLLELGAGEKAENKTTGGLNLGPSKLYLLLQLHKTRPDVSDHEDSVVIELSDLNYDPHLELEGEDGGSSQQQTIDPSSLSLKELKKLLNQQRRRNAELKDFIKQARGGVVVEKKEPTKVQENSGKEDQEQEEERPSLDSMMSA